MRFVKKITPFALVLVTPVVLFGLLDFVFLFRNSSQAVSSLYYQLALLSYFGLVYLLYLLVGAGLLELVVWAFDRSVFASRPERINLLVLPAFVFSFLGAWIKLNFFYGTSYLRIDLMGSLVGAGIFSLAIGYGCFVGFEARLFRRVVAVGLFLAVGVGLTLPVYFGYSLPERRAESAEGRPNVIVLLVDTLHAKHLGAYGYDRETAPRLRNLAETNLLFERVFSTAPWTRPAVATVFTGLYPPVHNTYKLSHKLPDNLKTLPEVFYRNGYRTMAVSANTNISPYFGFNRGFQDFVGRGYNPIANAQIPRVLKKMSYGGRSLFDLPAGLVDFGRNRLGRSKQVDAERVNERALGLFDDQTAGDRPFFMYMHYMDPHAPYDPPADHLGTMPVSGDYDFETYDRKYMTRGWPFHKIFPFYEHDKPPEPIFETIKYQYDAEIRYWDHWFEQFLERLKSRGLYENTLLVVTADHGEEFLQHGNWKHGKSLFNEILHVPLVVRLPDRMETDPERIDEPVSLLDLKASLLDWVGIRNPERGQGQSFVPMLREGSEGSAGVGDRPLFAVSDGTRARNRLFTMIEDGWKIHRISNGPQQAWRFYRYERDYREQEDRRRENPRRFNRFQGELKDWIERVRSMSVNGRTVEIEGKVRKDLKGMGYIQ